VGWNGRREGGVVKEVGCGGGGRGGENEWGGGGRKMEREGRRGGWGEEGRR